MCISSIASNRGIGAQAFPSLSLPSARKNCAHIHIVDDEEKTETEKVAEKHTQQAGDKIPRVKMPLLNVFQGACVYTRAASRLTQHTYTCTYILRACGQTQRSLSLRFSHATARAAYTQARERALETIEVSDLFASHAGTVRLGRGCPLTYYTTLCTIIARNPDKRESIVLTSSSCMGACEWLDCSDLFDPKIPRDDGTEA